MTESVRTTRADLILAQAKRAKNPGECAAVGRAVEELARVATAEDLDVLDEAMASSRDTLEAFRSRRVIQFRSRKT